jgi:phosphate transport system substrate-binding protein
MSSIKAVFLKAVIAIVSVTIMVVGCKQRESKSLTATGSTTVLPIAQNAAERFMDKHLDVNISVHGGGSGVGIAAITDGTADIANSSRSIKDKEIENCKAKGITPVGTIIARDGIAIIVHPHNPITELNLIQLKNIFTGNIKNWNEVGGENKKIVVVSRDVASGTFELFKKKVLEGKKTREDALMLASNKAVLTTVENTPDGIGYIGLGYLSKNVKPLDIEGVKASQKTVLSDEYKISRPLYMYTNGEPEGLEKEFIDYILSPDGQRIVEEVGFVSIK